MELSILRTSNITKVEVRLRYKPKSGVSESLLKAISILINEPTDFILNYSFENNSTYIYEPNSDYRVEWSSDSALIFIRGELTDDTLSSIRTLKVSNKTRRISSKLVIYKESSISVPTKYESMLKRVSVDYKEPAPSRFSSLIKPDKTKSTSLESSIYESNPSLIIRERLYWLIDQSIGSSNRFSFNLQSLFSEVSERKDKLRQSLFSEASEHTCRQPEIKVSKIKEFTRKDNGASYHTPLPFAKMFALITSDYQFEGFEIVINERVLSPTIKASAESIRKLERWIRSQLKEFEYW